jgi:hypothetical protein
MIDISISAADAYITAVSVVGAVVSLIWENRSHLEKCPVCGRPKKDNAVYSPGARHALYYEHRCQTPEGVTMFTTVLYGRESTFSFWYGLENGTVLEASVGRTYGGPCGLGRTARFFRCKSGARRRKSAQPVAKSLRYLAQFDPDYAPTSNAHGSGWHQKH